VQEHNTVLAVGRWGSDESSEKPICPFYNEDGVVEDDQMLLQVIPDPLFSSWCFMCGSPVAARKPY
jgi:hypothetical protein